jgi:hypothetical protein
MRTAFAILAVLLAWVGALSAPVGLGGAPANLEECLAELQRRLPPDLIVRMRNGGEEDMIDYHHGLGTGIRNEWGLWRRSPLNRHFNDLGIHHPDDMSWIILTSFWRRLHGQPLDVKGHVARSQRYRAAAQQSQGEEERRVQWVKGSLPALMMGLTVAEGEGGTAIVPKRSQEDDELRARHLFPYAGGALVTAREGGHEEGPFRLEPYYYDSSAMTLRPVQVAGLVSITSVVALGNEAYFLGRDEAGTSLVVAIIAGRRLAMALPRPEPPVQLGVDGDSVLLLYARSIYHREADDWKRLYEGPQDLPWSGPPPRRAGRYVYFRDEGRDEVDKRLWWLDLENATLVSLDRDCRLVGSYGPRWENTSSYALTADGQLWAAVGGGVSAYSLLRRSPDGGYRVALMNGEPAFDGELLSGSESGRIHVSAVSITDTGSVLAAGDTGLYRIGAERVETLVTFSNAKQDIPWGETSVYHWGWEPSDVLDLGGGRYLISGMYGGIYVLERNGGGPSSLRCVDNVIGEPMTL